MTSIVNSSLTRLVAAVVAVSLVAGFAFTFTASKAQAATLTSAQISSIISLLQSFGADATTIANVSASLQGTAPVGGGSTGGGTMGSCTFTRNLTVGSKGADVTCLQTALIAAGYSIPAGATGYFGAQTVAAVSAWQKAAGVSPAVGYFGAISRAAWGKSTGGGTVVTPPTTGTGLMVAAGTQPANSLAPEGASRVPFTRFTLTAGNDGDVSVSGVVVQRTGLGSNAAFAGVILVDEATGKQFGTAKTFNSNNQATVGETMTIPRGTSKTFLVAGNMAASLDSYAGESPSISVVAINTSATVSGSLPIVGANQTLNSTLAVGTVSLDTSNAFATNAVATKEIGTTAHRVSGFRLTAGSAEDLRLRTIRWNQTGSVSASDLTNVVTVVNGTSYPGTVSADGKYYDVSFGSGVTIAKGNSVEVYVQYDIIGSNASGRTVIFDVDKTTDIYLTGETYGYGVSPAVGSTAVSSLTRASSNTTETSGTPYIYGAQVTVSGASVTTIQKAVSVPAQNIAVNVPNQPLGGFETDIKGEAITVQSMVFTVASTTGSGTGLLTNVSIVNENGAVVAGPIDATYTSALVQTLTFTDSVTLPVGKHTYTIRGKVASTIGNGGTYIVSATPSSGWTNARGDVTGNSITFTQGAFSMNTMTVKGAALAVARATSPASQTVVAGGTSVLMTNFQLDATQSGEDVRLSSMPVRIEANAANTTTEGDYDLLTSCQLFDGSTALNTGSNVLNPTGATTTADYTATATFENPLTVAKGTVKTIGMRCNISASTPSGDTFTWDHGTITDFSATGVSSGTSITETEGSDADINVTVSTGSVTVTTDAGSPSYKLVAAGSTDVTVGAFKFRATNEAVNLQKLGLSLTNTASSSAGDLVKVSIYDGETKVGEAFFTGSATTATSTFTTTVTLPKDQDKTLTIKADLADIGTSQAVTFSGHLIAVDYLNAEGVGAQSGTTQQLSSAAGSTAVAGVRVMKSFPTLALDTLSSTGLADGRLMRFKVTADAKGPVSLTEFNFTFATTTVTLSNVNVFGYTDSSYSQPISGVQTGGQFSTTNGMSADWASSSSVIEFTAYSGSASTTIQVPAGTTRYFEVRGSVSGVQSGSSITTTLKSGTSFVTGTTPAANTTNPLAKATDTNLTSDFIWSPNSTTTPVRADLDWTGGYGIPGLPSNGLIQTRSN